MSPKKHLSFGNLREGLSQVLLNIEDSRQKGKCSYSIHDTMMAGFACMYFQDSSLVEFQERLYDQTKTSNLHSLFNVRNIPNSSQMRSIIDEVQSEELSPVFKDYFSRLQRGKHLKDYEIFPGQYLCAIDGTQYFSSKDIHCDHCLTKERKSGFEYSHSTLQAAVVHPDKKQVIPLMPEEICNEDGFLKQDCEVNAAKRLIPKIRKDHPQLGIIIVGDGLYSRQPMIEKFLSEHMSYILVAKDSDHKWLSDWINAYGSDLPKLVVEDEKGRRHEYEWMNDVALHAKDDSIHVNYFRYRLIVKTKSGKEKVTYSNSWVTNKEITAKNVVLLVRGGRCRWKIENECFNTLKNQGYHIEHNYGHGQKNLCYNFFILTLLAFFVHQIMELTDHLYQACRKKFCNKRYMWETLMGCVKMVIYKTWEALLSFALEPPDWDLKYG